MVLCLLPRLHRNDIPSSTLSEPVHTPDVKGLMCQNIINALIVSRGNIQGKSFLPVDYIGKAEPAKHGINYSHFCIRCKKRW